MNIKQIALFCVFFTLLAVNSLALDLNIAKSELQRLLKTLPAARAVGLEVRVLGSNRILLSHNSEKLLLPASNAKILTSLAALDKLGPSYVFHTAVMKEGDDIVLVGNGDPYLVSERIWLLARQVARAGIKKVHSIKVNQQVIDEDYKGLREWSNSGEPFTSIVSPTSVNFNSIEVHVIPQLGQKKPNVEFGPVPHDYAELVNEVKQAPGAGKELTITPVEGKEGKEKFIVRGTIGSKTGEVVLYSAVENPEAYIAYLFAALLKKEGVEVAIDYGGQVAKKFWKESDQITRIESLPLQDLVRLQNTYSNNFMAEQVFAALGMPESSVGKFETGSRTLSRSVVESYLKREKDCVGVKIENGSGLSWETQVSAKCILQVLQKSYVDFSVFADVLGSMPIGGESGSLKSRFKALASNGSARKIRAKTGTLWSQEAVSSLVGFTSLESGEVVSFAILANDKKQKRDALPGMKAWEEKCVELIQKIRL